MPLPKEMNKCFHFKIRYELGCTLQEVEKDKIQRSASVIENLRELKEQQMALRARVLATPTLISSTRCNNRLEFLNRDFNAAINISRCAVLKTRPAELAPSTFVRHPLNIDVYTEQMN